MFLMQYIKLTVIYLFLQMYQQNIAYKLILHAIVFGSKSKVLESLNFIKLKINNTPIDIVDSVCSLGLTMDNTFIYKSHIAKCADKAFPNLKMLFPLRSILPYSTKLMLCNSIVLSNFNYCCQIFAPCSDALNKYKGQKDHTCLRYVYGIRKYQRISHKLTEARWLDMTDRFLAMSACLYYKIICNKLRQYLYNKITFRTDVHNLNLRFKSRLTPP